MNEYDSSKMVDMMCTERNMQQTKDPSEADLILLNTCSIREKPQEKVFSQLGRWKPLKKQNPELINDSTYDLGWVVILEPHNYDEDQLLDPDEYVEYIAEL